MRFHNGHNRLDAARHLVDKELDAFTSGLHKVVDRVIEETEQGRSRIKSWTSKATESIKEHPYLAVGVAFGLGYVVVKIARR